jgi:MSHA pilin protein MshC
LDDQRAFTLVELVTVILLLGILSVVALPRFFDATAYNSRGFYDAVAGAARYGQKLAVASGCDVQLVIAGGNYALSQRQSCIDHNSAFNRPVLQPAGGDPFAGSAPNGMNLAASAAAVVFDAQGRATPGGVTVTVDGRTFTITGESGYVDMP